ncbi:EAL domain-containing protein [Acidovorax sp. RAC01]|uniref:EAL domain-containing protein n=1 Tax=Acidovorax sp. RAC01 TaxID=1842533 RepID=UPI00083E8A21|nr:EAL domain-containing protein [Acidovorax sp. RAC01]AOG21652.1 EAL domain protein [Acidovorax sp. RAC01]
MLSGSQGYVAMAVEFPPLGHAMLFWVFATLVVVVCQRLVEHTAHSVDPSSRRISASHSALCIGCIVWALDVVGLFMYAELKPHAMALDLLPALSGLIIMVASTRLALPVLSTSTSKLRITLASLFLGAGMLAAHFMVTRDHVASFRNVQWAPIAVALVLATGIAVVTSLHHRLARYTPITLPPLDRREAWHQHALAGLGVVVLHWLVVNAFPLHADGPSQPSGGNALMLIVLLFGAALAVEQLSNMRSDASRQAMLRKGMSMMRASSVLQSERPDSQLPLIADNLDRLLQRSSLALHFQPMVDASQRGPAQFEALLRIEDRRLGAINPEAFLLVCELQGKTVVVDKLILRNALDCIVQWQARGLHDASVSVNVAPATLLDVGFVPWLREEMAARRLYQTALKLEITEHAFIALGPQMLLAIRDLGAMGVAVVMDDFGAGYSSLGMLADLPIAGIKCDRLFVRDLASDKRRQLLLGHIGTLAGEFGLTVVVEGVESAAELRAVSAAGLHIIQGHLLSKPMPADDVPVWCAVQLEPRRSALQALLAQPLSDPAAPQAFATSAAVPPKAGSGR